MNEILVVYYINKKVSQSSQISWPQLPLLSWCCQPSTQQCLVHFLSLLPLYSQNAENKNSWGLLKVQLFLTSIMSAALTSSACLASILSLLSALDIVSTIMIRSAPSQSLQHHHVLLHCEYLCLTSWLPSLQHQEEHELLQNLLQFSSFH